MMFRRLLFSCLGLFGFWCVIGGQCAEPLITRVPGDGIQPQALTAPDGTVHLVYYKGEPKGGDLIYVRRPPGSRDFSQPVQVNSVHGSAIALGTIRGAQIALGRNNRIHVAWMGSPATMFYARSNDDHTAFEPQRNLVQARPGLDGGGAITADPLGHVFAVWHAPATPNAKDESDRRVWIVKSNDDGKTFTPETDAAIPPQGVCACCNLAAWSDENSLHILYRCATEKIHRDMHLLTLNENLHCINDQTVSETEIGKCIMSTGSFAHSVAAFESNGQVHWIRLAAGAEPITAPGIAHNRKHPSIAINSRAEVLLAWAEDSSWTTGGHLAWQLFDPTGKPTGDIGHGPQLPPFSLPASLARPDGSFVIVY
jgi:hypothetical protein